MNKTIKESIDKIGSRTIRQVIICNKCGRIKEATIRITKNTTRIWFKKHECLLSVKAGRRLIESLNKSIPKPTERFIECKKSLTPSA